jgi:hypothetical protein
MSTQMALSDQEAKLIENNRAKKAQQQWRINNRIKTLVTALRYDKWLIKHGRCSSFSAFVDEYGYEGNDASDMYKVVMEAIKAAYKR